MSRARLPPPRMLLLPAVLLWLGAAGAGWGSPIGVDDGGGAVAGVGGGAADGRGVVLDPQECPEVRRSPPAAASGPSVLAHAWPPAVTAALAAARAVWSPLEAGAAPGTADDWERLARALLERQRHVEAVAVEKPGMRLLVYRRSDGLRSVRPDEAGAAAASPPGYWKTLEQVVRRRAAAAAAAAAAGGKPGGRTPGGEDDCKEDTALPAVLWPHPFYDCNMGAWLFAPGHGVHGHNNTVTGVFFNVGLLEVDPCDSTWGPLLYGGHRCDPNTTLCVPFSLGPGPRQTGWLSGWPNRMSYRCQCRYGYGPVNPPGGTPPLNDSYKEPPQFTCAPCPKDRPRCGLANTWEPGVRTGLKIGQGAVMATVLLLGLVVFKKRKCKVVASSMWMMLETLLLGALLMQTAVVLKFVEPSMWTCLLEPWCREMGFVVCYGSIILKLYRILVEFRTRKAHRWVLKDRDLLRHLGAMVLAVFAYLAALTAASLHFYNEGFQLLDTVTTADGMVFPHCKLFWWDWVTQAAELVSLLVGLHLAWASRSFRTQFNERIFLCTALVVELFFSSLLYVAQALRLALRATSLSPTKVLVVYFVREQLSITVVVALVFVPVLWLAQRQPAARSLLPALDSLGKPADAAAAGAPPGGPAGPGTGFHSSDVDVTEITLKDMNPDDIRAELKRLYTQLEILRNKQMRHNNPHISKRRGGRKVGHRRFSLQKRGSREKALHHRHMRSSARHHTDVEVTEAEGSRTPEDSVCSQEGPSAVFNDGPSTYSEYGYGTPSVSYKGSCK